MIVPPEGPDPDDVELVILGQNPGANEERLGRPLVGATGRFMRNLLTGLDLLVSMDFKTPYDRFKPLKTNVYLTNASKCACPPDREKVLEELNQLKNLQLILAVGADAWKTLSPDAEGITKSQGVLTWVDAVKNWVLPIMHPAYMFRMKSPAAMNSAFMNTWYAVSWVPEILSHGPPPTWEVNTRVIDDPDKFLRAYKGFLKYQQEMAMDVESSGVYWYRDRLGCMSLAWTENDAVVLTENCLKDERVIRALDEWFHNKDVTWIGHNAKFDAIFSKAHLGTSPNFTEDTIFIQFCEDTRSAGGHLGLKDLGRIEWLAPDWQVPLLTWMKEHNVKSFTEVDPDVLYPYAGKDAAATFKAYKMKRPRLKDEPGLEDAYQLMIQASRMFEDLDTRGVYIDIEKAKKLKQEFEDKKESLTQKAENWIVDTIFEPLTPEEDAELAQLQQIPKGERTEEQQERIEDLSEIPEYKINLGSTKQLGELLYGELGLPVLQYTPGGKPSTNQDALTELTEKFPDLPIWRIVEDYRHAVKMLGTYINPYISEWSLPVPGQSRFRKLYPDTSLTATDTGRLSTRKGQSAALMTYPRGEMRSIFVAGPDHREDEKYVNFDNYFLFGPDYSQLEMRMAAWMSQDEYMIGEMKKGYSFHHVVARMVYGETYDKKQYTVVKGLVFGLLYSGGNIWAGFDPKYMSRELVEKVEYMFKTKATGLWKWFQETASKVQDPGYIVTPYGRRFRFPYIGRGMLKEMQKKAVNAVCQSTASDLTLSAMLKAYEELDQREYISLRWMMHDAIYGYVHKDNLKYLLDLWDIMEGTGNDLTKGTVPIKAEMSIGKNWNDLKDFDSREEFLAWIGT